ncbi:unnamed protein product [Zymoseptoria tritici ST99CH_1A5]|uniref:Mitochondrial distribution and morphology protein 35 n=2 Tax=Zymoseptoria tritici TaxID=1047171 RepID=A0A2H1H3A4_ZYMTR|nr:unnamed protein product [Zymoseptoria tritici ST99CH_1E4]SMY28736.1 unnamed protein product [Zymoseptoria tritici ST99CH_1A5]
MSASLASECNEVKERYDSCFLKWYSEKYVRGVATTDECEPLFKQYQVCLKKALKDRVRRVASASASSGMHINGVGRIRSIPCSIISFSSFETS